MDNRFDIKAKTELSHNEVDYALLLNQMADCLESKTELPHRAKFYAGVRIRVTKRTRTMLRKLLYKDSI